MKRKIKSGIFAELFNGEDSETHERVVVKLELLQSRRSRLEWEAEVYRQLNNFVGIPRLYYYGKTRKHAMLVISFLGKSLEELASRLPYHRFTLKTVLMLADQMLSCIEAVHRCGIVHRDVKPDNFLIGTGKARNQVFIIDFNVSKSYLTSRRHHIPFFQGRTLTGTARYASVGALEGKEQSRRDDLEALGYTWLYLLRGNLPWMGFQTGANDGLYANICKAKASTPFEELCRGFPDEFCRYFQLVRSLSFTEDPHYDTYRAMFREAFLRENFIYDYMYDWVKMKRVSEPKAESGFEEAAPVKKSISAMTHRSFGTNHGDASTSSSRLSGFRESDETEITGMSPSRGQGDSDLASARTSGPDVGDDWNHISALDTDDEERVFSEAGMDASPEHQTLEKEALKRRNTLPVTDDRVIDRAPSSRSRRRRSQERTKNDDESLRGDDLRHHFSDLIAERDHLSGNVAQLDQIMKSHSEKISGLEERLSELQQTLAETRQTHREGLASEQAKIADLDRHLSETIAERDNLSADVSNLRETMKSKSDQIADLEKQLIRVQTTLDEARQTHDEASTTSRTRIAELEHQLSDITIERDHLSGSVTKLDQIVKTDSEKINDLEGRLSELQQTHDETRQTPPAALISEQAKIADLDRHLSEVTAELDRLSADVARLTEIIRTQNANPNDKPVFPHISNIDGNETEVPGIDDIMKGRDDDSHTLKDIASGSILDDIDDLIKRTSEDPEYSITSIDMIETVHSMVSEGADYLKLPTSGTPDISTAAIFRMTHEDPDFGSLLDQEASISQSGDFGFWNGDANSEGSESLLTRDHRDDKHMSGSEDGNEAENEDADANDGEIEIVSRNGTDDGNDDASRHGNVSGEGSRNGNGNGNGSVSEGRNVIERDHEEEEEEEEEEKNGNEDEDETVNEDSGANG
jgi:serine/threonine protein kinase